MKLHPDIDSNLDLQIAAQACEAGGRILTEYWKNPPGRFEIKSHSHYELVSEADEAIDFDVLNIFRAQFPEDAILSEELNPETVSGTTASQLGRLWIVDPLDGTSGFLFRTDPFVPSVMIALMVDGVAELAVVHQPLVGRITVAVKGKGTYVNGKEVHIKNDERFDCMGWVDMNHYGDAAYESDTFCKIDKKLRSSGGARLVTRSTPSSVTALRLLDDDQRLSACIHDHNPVKPKQLPWDIVPIQLIIEEAGGKYVDALRGGESPLDPFNLQGPIIIGNNFIVKEILKHIA